MEDNFNSRLGYLSEEIIQSIYDKYKLVELNNVLEGFESDFFTISFSEDTSLDDYELMYIGNYGNIRGLTFRSGQQLIERDIYTFRFARAIEDEFPELNSLVIFNTFQSKLKQVYENFGIICIPENISRMEGHKTFLFSDKRKRGVASILQIDILEFYRDFFSRGSLEKEKNGISKVYLMYDRKENLVKIGETQTTLQKRKKGVAEPTLRGTDQMIEIITAWYAPKELETILHNQYSSKRIRGEWFDLRAIDLQEIDKQTLDYKMIDINYMS
ncbi:GIY-YIG nuclease family protein [Marinifilum fragile]|uniref:GIY-YIG nuclease family protein n=1 Tax=Marinifilum fragile TaxID=570161 RepID=UPI002AAAEA91|nr:GIY-YIG nuclease family protein [Marinifilum fragile]